MNNDDNFEKLTYLHSCLKLNTTLPEELNQWLLSGLDKLSTGQAKTIDESLSLEAKPGYGAIGNRLQKNIRNKLIINLVSLDTESKSKWAAAKKASRELLKFHRRNKNFNYDKSKFSEKDKLLFEIFKIDDNTPTSETFIYILIKNP